MAKAKMLWRRGRGALGALNPLLGTWVAIAGSAQGRVRCKQTFSRVLGGAYVQLVTNWRYGQKTYDELALYGVGENGKLSFWSFTSDGKNSRGTVADGSDIHPEALGFQAAMPAGLARMVYWPDEDGGFVWAVEAKTKKGWKRFTEHHYKKA